MIRVNSSSVGSERSLIPRKRCRVIPPLKLAAAMPVVAVTATSSKAVCRWVIILVLPEPVTDVIS